jgi:autotransporter-associated beta strand protein
MLGIRPSGLAFISVGFSIIWRQAVLAALAVTLLLTGFGAAHAQDATWLANPGSNNYELATNWSPNVVPVGTATFGQSNTTSITFVINPVCGIVCTVDQFVFSSGAPQYSFYLGENQLPAGPLVFTAGFEVEFTGQGIVNNSSFAPQFTVVKTSDITFNSGTAANANFTMVSQYASPSTIQFLNNSNAGTATFNNTGFGIEYFSTMQFLDTASAASATIVNGNGGQTVFFDNATAANATITNNAGANAYGSGTATDACVPDPPNGCIPTPLTIFPIAILGFVNNATAGAATITNQNAGVTIFDNSATGGNATLNNNVFGVTVFQNSSTAGNAIITNTGTGGAVTSLTASAAQYAGTAFPAFVDASWEQPNNGAGLTQFSDQSSAGQATITNSSGGVTVFGFSGGTDTADAGSARITNNSGGATYFLADTTASGATIINKSGGIVDISGLTALGIGVGSLSGAGNVFLGSRTLTLGALNGNDTISGVISNGGLFGGTGGSLVKTGTGMLTLSGIDTYTGATTVNVGTLVVDGSIASSSLTTVNTGATLAGSGTVGSTAITGGTLAPGSAGGSVFGPLTVQGNLSFTAASTYLIQVSPANAGLTKVTGVSGAATLGGATVDAVFMPGSYISKQYTIVNAAGGVSGAFNPAVVSNMANLQPTLTYDNNDAFLNIKVLFSTPNGLNINQQNVANALTGFFNANGGIPFAFAALNAAGLTMASGELATASQQTTFDAMSLFMGVLTDPFMNRVGGAGSSPSASGYAEEGDASAYAATRKTDAFAMFTKAPPAPFEPRWSVWAAGFGGSQTTDGNAALGSNAVTSRIFGTAVGADYLFSPRTIAGFALAGGGTNFSLANGLGSGRSDLFQAGAYIRHNAGPAYITAALAYGWQDITTNRTVTIAGTDMLQARFNANAFSGRLEGGYRFIAPYFGGFGLTPYAAVQATTFDLPAYAESVLSGAGTFALAYNAKSATDTRSELGIRTDKSYAMADGILTLRGRTAWAHDYDPDRSIAATFQTLPGASFVVNGAAQAHDSLLSSEAVEFKWTNGWSAAATFESEYSNVTRSYAGKGVIRYIW